MYRDWQLDDGEEHHDVIRRRVVTREELDRGLAGIGFTSLACVEGFVVARR